MQPHVAPASVRKKRFHNYYGDSWENEGGELADVWAQAGRARASNVRCTLRQMSYPDTRIVEAGRILPNMLVVI